MLLFVLPGLLLACSPAVLRVPGPLTDLGRERPLPVAVTPPEAAPAGESVGRARTGERMARAARAFLGDRNLVVAGEKYRYDCSGLVEAVMASVGAPWRGSTEMLFEAGRDEGVLHHRKLPAPGDVAFFDDTYDRDGNGKLDDPLSHSAIVEAVDDEGTITLIHVGSKGVVRFKMNLRHPDVRAAEDGTVLNDYLRAKGKDDDPRTRYLAGELWRAFGSFWKRASGATS